ncbi:hypothetical protein IAD21_00347 [Abditibacteriota bacterium]|nr:hypothetical protein IAD21_00347 [Abditibacteriota bacterium]
MTEHQQQRLVNWRLKILQEAAAAVAPVCRKYGISRQTFYKWKKRFEDDGEAGLCDRSQAAHHFPRATHPDIVEKVLYLRQSYDFGAPRISMYLARYHDLILAERTIHNILTRYGFFAYRRTSASNPINSVGVATKSHCPITACRSTPSSSKPFLVSAKVTAGGEPCQRQFTAIDDCTRLRILKIYERNNQKNACDFVDYVLSRLPFRVQTIQTDNGPEFAAVFHWHVLDKGIGHKYIKPRTPRLNGKVERSHRIDEEELYQLLEGVVIEDVAGFNTKLQEWEHFYNYQPPHGALDGQSPYERLRQKADLQD